MTPRCYVGLDLGQARDFSALAVLRPSPSATGTSNDHAPPVYDVPHLQRFPLGLPYPALVSSVAGLLGTPALCGAVLVVDRTGVGRAVVDLLAERLRAVPGCRLLPLTITAGRGARQADNGGVRVAKAELVHALRELVARRQLRVASSLPAGPALARELEAFRVWIGKDGREGFGAVRPSQHDDLVLALALAAWGAIQTFPPGS